MKRLAALTVACGIGLTPTADAYPPALAKWCPGTANCRRPPLTRRERAVRANLRAHHRVFRFWSRQPIPSCTWVGESGPGPEFARWRYFRLNTAGSGARGKYQLMPGTYAAFARFFDWSRADQEYAAHRLYEAQGTAPWMAC